MPSDLFNYDVYGDVGVLQTSFDIFKYLRGVSEAFGMSHFFALNLPEDKSGSFSTLSLVNNWPPELIKSYDQADMINACPVMQQLLASSTPVVWSIEDVPAHDPSEKFTRICDSFSLNGFAHGVCFPVADSRRVRGVVGFSGERPAIEKSEILELNMISQHVYNRLSEIAFQSENEPQPLSARELECLRWTAVGKTSSEIATILDLSEHTVNHYLIGATKKLEAVNRTQAVANAIRNGWI